MLNLDCYRELSTKYFLNSRLYFNNRDFVRCCLLPLSPTLHLSPFTSTSALTKTVVRSKRLSRLIYVKDLRHLYLIVSSEKLMIVRLESLRYCEYQACM
jgi:hypothetical protein